MRKAILVHGWSSKEEFYDTSYPTLSNSHWFPWLSKQLMVKDIQTVAIEMPTPFQPVWEEWKKEFERYDIDERTLLVGHSWGGGFLVRWLSEHKDTYVGKVVLVAPSFKLDDNHEYVKTFFDFTIDPKLASRTAGVTMFSSTDDRDAIQASVNKIKQSIPGVKHKEFQDKGHFTLKGLGTNEFPQLLEEVI